MVTGKDMSISTPYYRDLTPIEYAGCTEEGDFHYGPHDIFRMETRLYPIVYKMLGDTVILYFKGIREKSRVSIRIFLRNSDDTDIHITDDQKRYLEDKVSEIISTYPDYYLIEKDLLYTSSRKRYPRSWFLSVLPYINIDTDHFIEKEGIYIRLNPESDYMTTYNQICTDIISTIDIYYKEGVIYGADKIKEDWDLVPISEDKRLFYPKWKDRRFCPDPVDFLFKKILGDPYISIKVSENMVTRHRIAEVLSNNGITDFYYNGNFIQIFSETLKESRKIATLIDTYSDINNHRVCTRSYKSPDQISSLKENEIVYRIYDVTHPYIVSTLI